MGSIVRLARPPALTPLLHSDANEWLGEVSSYGNWVAYESDESGDRVDIFVRPLSDVTARREKVSIDGGRYPMWSRTGTGELFYVDPDGAMMAASITAEGHGCKGRYLSVHRRRNGTNLRRVPRQHGEFFQDITKANVRRFRMAISLPVDRRQPMPSPEKR